MSDSRNVGVRNSHFIPRGPLGEKRCSKCAQYRPMDDFKVDTSRYDGRGYVCHHCRPHRVDAPGKPERQAKAAIGLRWCRGCSAWLPGHLVARQGVCQPCANAEERLRYATDAAFRGRRRVRASTRKRGVPPLPAEAWALLLEEFDGRCAYCGDVAETVDHVVPVVRGGQTEPANTVPACRACNSSKRDRDVWAWLESRNADVHPRFLDRLALADILPPRGPIEFD